MLHHRKSPRCYDREGNPITEDEALLLLADSDARLVDYTYIGENVYVSTIHMPYDMGREVNGEPVIFETMVFGQHSDEEDTWRYATEDEARMGHAIVVAWLKGKGPQP